MSVVIGVRSVTGQIAFRIRVIHAIIAVERLIDPCIGNPGAPRGRFDVPISLVKIGLQHPEIAETSIAFPTVTSRIRGGVDVIQGQSPKDGRVPVAQR